VCHFNRFDGDDLPSDFREGIFVVSIGIQRAATACGHMIEDIGPICAHNNWID